jgi:MFS family permease
VKNDYLTQSQITSDAAYKKISWRLLPLLFISYTLCYIDRLNVGYAQLQMKHDLSFSDAVYGTGAALFFVGSLLFEIPSNMLLPRIGARKTIFRIMVLWGLASTSTMFVRTPTEFYIARFLVGVFEAGLFPGVILYLTFWYPPVRRGRVISLFMLAVSAAGFSGGVISGWILQNMDGLHGLQGWQWMFLVEGLPCVLLAPVIYFVLVDRPEQAKWLSESEKDVVRQALAQGASDRSATHGAGAHSGFREPLVYVLSFVLFGAFCGSYTLAFWMPTMIRELGVSNLQHVGLYAAIPDICGAVAMVLYGRHSDKRKERRWHFGLAMVIGAAALWGTTMSHHSLVLSIGLFAIARCCIASAIPIFWAMSTSALSARSNVAGIAIILTFGNLAGVVSPYVLGQIKTATGNLNLGLYTISVLMVLAALVVFKAVSRPSRTADAGISAEQSTL